MKAMYSVERALIMFCGAFSRFLRIPVSVVCWVKRYTGSYMTQRNTMKNINVIVFDNLERNIGTASRNGLSAASVIVLLSRNTAGTRVNNGWLGRCVHSSESCSHCSLPGSCGLCDRVCDQRMGPQQVWHRQLCRGGAYSSIRWTGARTLGLWRLLHIAKRRPEQVPAVRQILSVWRSWYWAFHR